VSTLRLPLEYTAVRMPPGRRNGITRWRLSIGSTIIGIIYRKEGRQKETWGWEPVEGITQIFGTAKDAAQAATEGNGHGKR